MGDHPRVVADDLAYYDLPLRKAAEEFAVSEADMRSWLRRGALDGQFRDGQWWVHLGPRRGEDTVVCLWHGTSTDRAGTLLARGFWAVTAGNQVWLTTSELRARLHAIGRARRRRSTPLLVRCLVDLARYRVFWRPSSLVYVFHQPLGPEVIQAVDAVDEREQNRRFRLAARRRARGPVVDVAITRNAGPLGILFWINTWLGQHGLPPVSLDHPIVQDIVAWIGQEYANGREFPIGDDELEAKAKGFLQPPTPGNPPE